MGVGRELGPKGFGEGDRLGRHDVRQRTAQNEWAPAVDVVLELSRRQDQAAARPAQGLVSCCCHDVSIGEWG